LIEFRRHFGSVRPLGLSHPLMREMDELIRLAQPQSATPPVMMAGAVHQFIMHLFEQAESKRLQTLSPAEQAIDHLLHHPHLPMTMEQIAARFGCSREHLSRLFKERFGQSPAAWLNDLRGQRALR